MRRFHYEDFQSVAWDNDIVSLIAQIHEYNGRQELFLKQKPKELNRLVEIAKIQSTESSNKIEGIITTNTRIRELIAEKTAPRNRDEKEIAGYRDVLNLIHERYAYIPVKPAVIQQLHRDLYKYSGSAMGGRYKNTQNYISARTADGKEFTLFTPLAPYETPDAMEQICSAYHHAIDCGIVDPLLLIPIFIKDFLCIHPFNDGNGRMSRLLTALMLYQNQYMVGRYVSLERFVEKTKSAYYDVLQESSIGWHEGKNDYVPFIRYLLGIILRAYREFESRVDLFGEKLSAYDIVKRAIAEHVGDFTKKEILEKCAALSDSSVEAGIKKLCEEGMVQKIGNGRATRYLSVDRD